MRSFLRTVTSPRFEEGIMLFKLGVVGIGVGVDEAFKSGRVHASNGGEKKGIRSAFPCYSY